ncbi:MAG TPA: hypothetical protein VHM20_06190, partial [Gammaproteobacteria bacterium]|nr:hypothetical protein [Gammaproteobacteria bacterium]
IKKMQLPKNKKFYNFTFHSQNNKNKYYKNAMGLGISGIASFKLYKTSIDEENTLTLQSPFSTDSHSCKYSLEENVNQQEKNLIAIIKETIILFSAYMLGISYFPGVFSLTYLHPYMMLPLIFGDLILNNGEIFTFPLNYITYYLEIGIFTLQEHTFSQSQFIQLMNNRYPDAYYDEEGMCYGLTILWYLFEFSGKSLVSELKEITQSIQSKRPLNEIQTKILEEISIIQNHQRPFHIYIMKDHSKHCVNFFQKKIKFQKGLKEYSYQIQDQEKAIGVALQEAIKSPNSLVSIHPYNENPWHSHIIGIKTYYSGKQLKFKYFDSNFKETIFNNEKAAHSSISRLISNYYKNDCTHISVKFYSFKEKKSNLFWKNIFCPGSDTQLKSENKINIFKCKL